jgi:hypothetical protein
MTDTSSSEAERAEITRLCNLHTDFEDDCDDLEEAHAVLAVIGARIARSRAQDIRLWVAILAVATDAADDIEEDGEPAAGRSDMDRDRLRADIVAELTDIRLSVEALGALMFVLEELIRADAWDFWARVEEVLDDDEDDV